MSLKKIIQILFWRCTLPLLIGLTIYILLHKPDLLLHRWLSGNFRLLNFHHQVIKNYVAVFLLNHLPDCLWAYSLSNFLALFFPGLFSFKVKAAFIMVLVSATEIVQVFFPKQFTFDWIDLLLTIIVSFFTLIFWPYEKENSF